MSRSAGRLRRPAVAAAALAAAASVVPTGGAQSDKWWPGYGNGPDNSRYFASRQIDKANVNQLQVAWTASLRATTGGWSRSAVAGPARAQ